VGLCCGRFHKMQVSGRAVPNGTKARGRSPASLSRPSDTKRRYAGTSRTLRPERLPCNEAVTGASESGGGSALPSSEACMPDAAPADIGDCFGRTPDSVTARRLRRASDQLFRLWSAMMTMTKAATPTIPATALAVFTGLGAPPKISGVG